MNIDFERFVYILVALASIGVILLTLQKLKGFSKVLYSIILGIIVLSTFIYFIIFLTSSGIIYYINNYFLSGQFTAHVEIVFWLIIIYIAYVILSNIIKSFMEVRHTNNDGFKSYIKEMKKNFKWK